MIDYYSTDEECDECGAEAGERCYYSCPLRRDARADIAWLG